MQMFRYKLIFYYLLLYYICSISIASIIKVNPPKITMTKSFVLCPESKNATLIYKRVGRAPINSFYLIENYDVIVKEDINYPIGIEISNERCESRENPDSCSHFSRFKSRQFCASIESKTDFWSPFIVTCMDPPVKCPLRKGIYKGRNCTMNVKLLTFLSSDCSYWKLKLRYVNLRTNRLIGCNLFEALIC